MYSLIRKNSLLSFSLLMLSVAALAYSPAAADQDMPDGRVILDVKDSRLQTGAFRFDKAMLEQLPQLELNVVTPWTDGTTTFKGPLLRDVLEKAGIETATSLNATALNDYTISIPVEDAMTYNVILAMTMNGATLRVRDRGPLWVMYPWNDTHPELSTVEFHQRSIWQLKSLEVVP